MNDEKIKVRITENDQLIEVTIYSKSPERIEVIIGEGIHSTKCKLLPTDNGLAFVGNVMGREIVYEKSSKQIQDDIDSARPPTRRR